MSTTRIDFDGEPLKLVRNAYQQALDYQRPRNDAYKRQHKILNCYIDLAQRDPDRANIFIPKIWSIVRTKVPRDIKGLAWTRPYIPFQATRDEYKEYARVWEDVLDDLLYRANYFVNLVLASIIKTTYGTCFADVVPYWAMQPQSQQVMTPIGPKFVSSMTPRLRFRMKVWAPWEVFLDPFATNLEEPGGCRFVVKLQLASKREIIRMAQAGAYPGLDIEKLRNPRGTPDSSPETKHLGFEFLSGIGINHPAADDDIGVLFRYESPERFIDSWNGDLVIRDVPNKYENGMVNLSRWVHELDAHTQNQMWGEGEVKPNEILQELLNDLYNMAIDNHQLMNQGVIYHDKEAISAQQLIRTVGNRVAVKRNGDRPISDYVYESFGQSLPRDHYAMMEQIKNEMDMTAGAFKPGRGEEGDNKTATEAAILKQSEGSRHELNVKMGEQMFLSSFGTKCINMLDKMATVNDAIEVVGPQRAMMALAGSPGDIPGGFNLQFKGADRVADNLIQQRNWKELVPVLNQLGNVSPEFLSRKLLEVYGVPEMEYDMAVIPDMVMQQMKMAAMMAPQIEGSGKKYRENNPQQIGQDVGRESMRAMI